MANLTNQRDPESTADAEILRANAKLLKLRQSLQDSRTVSEDTATQSRDSTRNHADWPEIPETQMNPMIPNELERLQKEPKEVTDRDHGGAFAQSLKTAEVKPDESVLDPNLPLRTFLAKAALISAEQACASYDEGWKSSTWEFVRLCRSHPKFWDLSADEAVRKIPWNATGFDEEEQLQVLVEWDRVKSLPGVSPLEFAARLARRHPLYSRRKQFQS
jgi:hypothetical protein